MTYFDSIDPGVKYYAWARWEEFSGSTSPCLAVVGLSPIDLRLFPSRLLVIEGQEIRRGGRSKVRDSDIIKLARSSGRLIERYHNHVIYPASEWMGGSPPEDVLHRRILAQLTPTEQARLEGRKKSEFKHIIEAVGIGLYHMRKEGLRTCST